MAATATFATTRPLGGTSRPGETSLGGGQTWRTMNLAATTASLSGPEASSSFSAGATSWLKSTRVERADPTAFTRSDGAWSGADPNVYIGAWHANVERMMGLSSLAKLGERQQRRPEEAPGEVRAIILGEILFASESPAPPLSKAEVGRHMGRHRELVKGSFARRREAGRPVEPPTAVRARDAAVPGWIPTGERGFPLHHMMPPDLSKLGRIEAEMQAKFNGKVSAEVAHLRPPRIDEMRTAQLLEFTRGNELFDKADLLAALAEYEIALRVRHLRPYVYLNMGNAFKALLRQVFTHGRCGV